MGDLISRQAAIDALEWKWAGKAAIDAVKNLPSAQPEHNPDDERKIADLHKMVNYLLSRLERQWNPCNERLPEEGHDVLITKEPFKIKGYQQEVIKAKRSVDPRSGKIEWWSPEFGTLTNKAVLAWMPLPKPYRKEGGE